jgi:DNA processing protein
MAALSGPPARRRRTTSFPAGRHDLLTLALLGLTPAAAAALRRRAPVADILARPERHAGFLPARARERLRDGRARRAADEEEKRASRAGVRIVGLGEPEYPAWLEKTADPPLVLFVRGRLDPMEGAKSVAVVGARKVTPRGLALARTIARDLAARGLTIVSGLARGTDTAAHEGALDAGGRTVAVLGSGLDRPYPPENAPLLERIAEKGAVVSEMPLGTPPYKRHFPQRNRIIAGWSRGVVVVEATSTSGSLHTARCAVDEGREVMAVPGHPSEANAEGTNRLIAEGAALICGAGDVLAALELGTGTGTGTGEAAPRPPAEDALLRALTPDAPRGLEELRERSGLETPDLLARLSELEVASVVRRLPGALYVRHH